MREILGVRLLDLNEAAELLGTSTVTIRAYLKKGKLKGTKIARKWHIPEESIQQMVRGDFGH